MYQYPSITDLKRFDAKTIKGALTKMDKVLSITRPTWLDTDTSKGALIKMDKRLSISGLKRLNAERMDKRLSISGLKRLDAERMEAHRKIDEKKFHKKRWSENVLSQFSIQSQIVTCFTDDSFFEKVWSSKAFHLGIKSNCLVRSEMGTISERRQIVEKVLAKPRSANCSQAKSTSILESSPNLPPCKTVGSEEVISSSIPSSSCQNLSVLATRTTDLKVPDPAECSVTQSDEIPVDHADSILFPSDVVEPLRHSGFDCTWFKTPSGSYENSDGFSSRIMQKVCKGVVDGNITQKEVPKNVEMFKCSVVQQRVSETSSTSGTKITNSNSLSQTIDFGRISNSSMHGDNLNSAILEVTSMERCNLDAIQSSHSYLEDATKAVWKTGVNREVESSARISIETFHFELNNLAVVSIDNVPLSESSSEDSRSLDVRTYPTDWQVISNEEFTTLPAITQSQLDQDRNLIHETCLKSVESFNTGGSNDDLHQHNQRESNSNEQHSISKETHSRQSLFRRDDTQNVNIIKESKSSFGFRFVPKPINVSRTIKRVDVRSPSENLPGQYFGNASKSTNSTLKSTNDVPVNSYVQQTERIKTIRSEGNFIPIRSNVVRFVSEMKVVLERNVIADQMAIRDYSRGSRKVYKERSNVYKYFDSDTFSCLRCNVMFSTFQDLIRHIDGHKADKLYFCYYCQKQFLSNSARIRHVRIHTGEKPYPCPICNKSFTRLENMKTHRNIHKNAKKICEIGCKNRDRNNNVLCHSPGYSGAKFRKSKICRKSFPAKALKRHAKVDSDFLNCEGDHSRSDLADNSAVGNFHRCYLDKKPQQQDKKQFPYATKFSSKRDDGPFSCNCCPKTFSSSRGLKIHWKLVHVRASKHRAAPVPTKENLSQLHAWNLNPIKKFNLFMGKQNSKGASLDL